MHDRTLSEFALSPITRVRRSLELEIEYRERSDAYYAERLVQCADDAEHLPTLEGLRDRNARQLEATREELRAVAEVGET